MKMVDVGQKEKTERRAVASARVRMERQTLARIRSGRIDKGDVLAAARLAGVMATKRTPDVVPLCHPISISSVNVDIQFEVRGLQITAEVKTVDRTGVEMEALMAVSAASLTVYDMCKSVDRGMVIDAVQLESKSGGRSGDWNRSKSRRR